MVIKRLLNISGQQSQGGDTVLGFETSYSGDICYKIRSVLVYGFCQWEHCIWLLRMIRIEQLSQTQVNATQLLYVRVQSKHAVDENYFLSFFIYILILPGYFKCICWDWCSYTIKYTGSNTNIGHFSIVSTLYNSDWSLWIIVILPSSVGPGACTLTAIVVAGVIGYAYIKWKVRFDSFIYWSVQIMKIKYRPHSYKPLLSVQSHISLP